MFKGVFTFDASAEVNEAQARVSERSRARTHTHTQICNIYCFSRQKFFSNALQCYDILTLPVLFNLLQTDKHILCMQVGK
jgi:hypothetical protein